MDTFVIELVSSDGTLSTFPTTNKWYATTSTYTTRASFTATSSTAIDVDPRFNGSDSGYTQEYREVTPEQLSNYNLPKIGETWHMWCYGKFQTPTASKDDFSSPVIFTLIDNTNVTLRGLS